MSKKEIEDLLKKGAYGALMEEDNAGDSFCEEDIDMILQRRTKVIQIESEGKGSTFAKVSHWDTDIYIFFLVHLIISTFLISVKFHEPLIFLLEISGSLLSSRKIF